MPLMFLASPSFGQPLLINQKWPIQWNPFVLLNLCLFKLLEGQAEAYILFFIDPPSLKAGVTLRFSKCGVGIGHSRAGHISEPNCLPMGLSRALEKGVSLLKGGEWKEENSCRKECPFLLYFSSPSCKKEKRKTNTSQPRAH